MDIIPGTVVFGIGIGLLLSELTNLTMSAARSDQENDTVGFLNAFKNLGYSIGTALIGVLLLLGIFGGLTTAIAESSISGNMKPTRYNPVSLTTWKKCRQAVRKTFSLAWVLKQLRYWTFQKFGHETNI